MAAKKISLKKFAQVFEAETGFDLMDRDGRTVKGHLMHNIGWFREWAEETARRLEKYSKDVRGYRS